MREKIIACKNILTFLAGQSPTSLLWRAQSRTDSQQEFGSANIFAQKSIFSPTFLAGPSSTSIASAPRLPLAAASGSAFCGAGAQAHEPEARSQRLQSMPPPFYEACEPGAACRLASQPPLLQTENAERADLRRLQLRAPGSWPHHTPHMHTLA